MSLLKESQARDVQLPLRISQQLDEQLATLAQRWARTMTLDARIGKATIAREAMMRGIKLIEKELAQRERRGEGGKR